MKKQINPTIKAHLIRAAFYLILLVAVCAIPFALAQRKRPPREDVADGAALDRNACYSAQPGFLLPASRSFAGEFENSGRGLRRLRPCAAGCRPRKFRCQRCQRLNSDSVHLE